LTQARAGPTCVRHLADWGADVIRIEQPPTEEERGEVVGKRESVDYQNLNRNKRAVTLNLKDKRGHELFMKLAKDADIIVENQRAKVKFRLGIDYESIRKINPRIIYGSISGFGQDGPYADRAGLDHVVQGMSGLMSITGKPGDGPMRVGIAISDLTSGTYLALGLMIALFDRERTGEGRWVTTSLLESLIAMLDFQAARWLNKNEVPQQEGNFHPTATPTGTYPTSDGLISVSAAGHRLWARFCAAVGSPELAKDPRFATYEVRARNRKELNDVVAEHLAKRSTKEWVDILNDAGVPAGPVYNIDEMFEDPQVKFLQMTRPVVHPKLGEQQMVAQGFNISGYSKDIRMPTPGVGEHTFDILRGMGMTGEELEKLRSEGVI
jgi:crotonobetainyl-CoA:carnitine CoA-transferase CaiB-like acyl-CoA transferase